jgi:hypothetical protein
LAWKLAIRFLKLLFSLLFFITPSYADGLKWEKYKTVSFELKELPVGKMVNDYPSPDKKSKLLTQLVIENNIKTFNLYFVKDNKYSFIDQYQELKRVTWDKDSSKVYFHAIKKINYEEIGYFKLRYIPSKNLIIGLMLKIQD